MDILVAAVVLVADVATLAIVVAVLRQIESVLRETREVVGKINRIPLPPRRPGGTP